MTSCLIKGNSLSQRVKGRYNKYKEVRIDQTMRNKGIQYKYGCSAFIVKQRKKRRDSQFHQILTATNLILQPTKTALLF